MLSRKTLNLVNVEKMVTEIQVRRIFHRAETITSVNINTKKIENNWVIGELRNANSTVTEEHIKANFMR